MKANMFRWMLLVCLAVGVSGGILLAAGSSEAVELAKQGAFAQARPLLEQALGRNPSDSSAHAYLGLCYLDYAHDPNQAIPHLEEAVRLDGGNALYHYYLGAAYGQKAMQGSKLKALFIAPKCREQFEKAVWLDREKKYTYAIALTQYYLQAPGIVGGGKDKARKLAELLRKSNPVASLLVEAQLAADANDRSWQERSYRQAVALEPGNPRPSYFLGGYLMGQKRFDEALSAFRRAHEIDPKEPIYLESIGDVLAAKGQREEAMAIYRKCLEINPYKASAQLEIANCLEKMGRIEEARKAAERFLQLCPTGSMAAEVRRRMAEQRRQNGK